MLRASAAQTDVEVELRGIAQSGVDPLLGAGSELRRFVAAAVLRTDDLDEARVDLEATVGGDGAVRAAGVVGNFEMMNRLVDGAGVRVPKPMAELADDLGIARPPCD